MDYAQEEVGTGRFARQCMSGSKVAHPASEFDTSPVVTKIPAQHQHQASVKFGRGTRGSRLELHHVQQSSHHTSPERVRSPYNSSPLLLQHGLCYTARCGCCAAAQALLRMRVAHT